VGAQVVMQCSLALGSRLVLSAKNCNTIVSDSSCWFDPVRVSREYALTLSRPFERGVALLLLNTVATHSTLIFQSIEYSSREDEVSKDFNFKIAAAASLKSKQRNDGAEDSANAPNKLLRAGTTGTKTRREKLSLKISIAKDREQYFDDAQLALLHGMRLLQQASSNRELGRKLFYEADADGSGQLDKEELQAVLHRIGFAVEEERLNDIMAVFDVDGEGTIEMNGEFSESVSAQHNYRF
jgi:hypothetical protein